MVLVLGKQREWLDLPYFVVAIAKFAIATTAIAATATATAIVAAATSAPLANTTMMSWTTRKEIC